MVGTRQAFCFQRRDKTDFAVFTRDKLAPGDRISGPALIDEGSSVTVIHTGQSLVVDVYGHLIVTALSEGPKK
jgi:N-methylhydantoinase A